MKIYDFHTHTYHSDGELGPAELIRYAYVSGYAVVGITDHVDFSNIETVLKNNKKIVEDIDWDITPIIGVEITHVPARRICKLAKKAKDLGARIVVVHGETIVEPVDGGTNSAAVRCPYVDLLAHPGFLSIDDAEAAKENGIYVEITARKGHCLTNGHVAGICSETKVNALVSSDAHSPRDMLNADLAAKIVKGAGLDSGWVKKILETNPKKFLKARC